MSIAPSRNSFVNFFPVFRALFVIVGFSPKPRMANKARTVCCFYFSLYCVPKKQTQHIKVCSLLLPSKKTILSQHVKQQKAQQRTYLAQNSGLVDADIVKMNRACGTASNPQFVLWFANAQARISAFNNEASNSFVSLGRIDVGKNLK